MRNWRPPLLQIFRPDVKLHRAQPQRAFRIKRYTGATTRDAAKTVARYRYKPPTLVKEPLPPKLPVVEEIPAEKEPPQQGLVRKIIFGTTRDTQENIAAYEQRHPKLLDIVKGTRETASNEEVKIERGSNEAIKGSRSSSRARAKAATQKGKAAPKEKNKEHQLRRRRSFFAQTQSLGGSKGSLKSSQARRNGQLKTNDGQSPPQSKSKISVSFDAHIPKHAEPSRFQRPNFWSRMSSRNVRDTEGRSEFEPVTAERAPSGVSQKEKGLGRAPKRRLSLFEELFPEEAGKQTPTEANAERQGQDLLKLSLPQVDEDDAFEDEYTRGRKLDSVKAEAASKDAFRLWNPSILVLEVASPSLSESDFRRIAPKGQHISKWTGPGDYFKVIPGRNTQTLKQETHYFLIFPNPAYARAYQSQVIHLHVLARTHTPTSIESPMTPPKGMFVKGEDVYSLLQDYTLCPPSQKISLLPLFPPLSAKFRRILRNKGYPEITQPRDKTGQAVLFWVEGFVPTMDQVQQLVIRDGRHRGMAWALMNGKNSIQQIEPDRKLSNDDDDEEEKEDDDEPAPTEREGPDIRDYVRRTRIRWTIALEDENEARRFVRRWHLRPFSDAFPDRQHSGDHAPLVHAEFLW